MKRIMTTAKGMTIETNLTDDEALAALARVPGSFAADLVRKARRFGLSRDQMAWAHKLVIDSRDNQTAKPRKPRAPRKPKSLPINPDVTHDPADTLSAQALFERERHEAIDFNPDDEFYFSPPSYRRRFGAN